MDQGVKIDGGRGPRRKLRRQETKLVSVPSSSFGVCKTVLNAWRAKSKKIAPAYKVVFDQIAIQIQKRIRKFFFGPR